MYVHRNKHDDIFPQWWASGSRWKRRCSGASFETISVISVLHAMVAMAVNSTMFLFDLHEEWVIRVVMLGKIF